MISVRPFTAADVALGMRLKAAAGWNQTEADWRRLLALEPAGCFVGLCGEAPAATLTTTVFGDVAWAAMVLTDPAFRGRGLATALLTHALSYLERRGVAAVRLDATSLGRPVYEKLGFRVVSEQRRYYGSPIVAAAAVESAADDLAPLTMEQSAEAGRLDAAATGNDRTRLLELVRRDWPEAALGTTAGGELGGFLLCRRGSRAPQLGPCIAADPRHGARLLHTALARSAGTPVYVDVPTSNRSACRVVEEHGLGIERTFLRMTLGREVAAHEEANWANYGPELG